MSSAHLATAVHESLAEEHLGEEAAGAPQVDADAVAGGAQQQLRSTVRERDDRRGWGVAASDRRRSRWRGRSRRS